MYINSVYISISCIMIFFNKKHVEKCRFIYNYLFSYYNIYDIMIRNNNLFINM